jgi:tetratricopeptide (TPR) repeat protein
VFVGSFSNLVNARTPDPVAEGLRDAVAADLAAFPEFSVATVHNARPPPASALFLTGVMRPVAGGIEISLLLSPRVGGAATWTTTVEASFDDTNLDRGLADAARRLVSPIAAFDGPLLAGGRAWLAAQREVEDQPTPFACLLRFRVAGTSGSAIDHGRAALCFERLLARNPRDGDALAVSAWYTARRALQQAAPGDNLLLALRPASDMARAALALAPGSALAQAMAGRALSMAGQDEAARRALIAALSLSPANLDVRAAYAWVLGTSGEWHTAEAEAGAALTAAPGAPPWYHAVPSLGAYRRGDYVRAADEALAFSRADDLMAPIFAVAAGARAHRGDLVNRFTGHLLADPVYRRSGIIAPLALRLHDTQLLHDIADGLSLAGVPQASIWGSF